MTDALFLEKRFVRRQAFFSSVICAMASLVYYLPNFPFDRSISRYTLLSSACYMAFFVLFPYLDAFYLHAVALLSSLAMVLLGFIVHMTGGLASPFIFLYFAIFVSESAYGINNSFSLGVAIASFLVSVGGEYFGVFPVRYEFTARIYESGPTTALLVGAMVSFMFLTGFSTRLIMKRLRAKLETENAEKTKLLKKFSELDSSAQIGALAHRIVHDMRAPLSSISGYIQMEMMKKHGPDDTAALKDVNEVVNSMVESLKGITRFGKDTHAPSENIELPELMTTLMAVIVYSPHARGVRFRKLYAEREHFRVNASRADLQQAFFNIFRNALEAVHDNSGERRIAVDMKRCDAEVEISIVDNGPGMAPEVLKALFRKSMTTKSDGTGVGLLITRDMLVRNGGDIQFFNVPEGGLRASIRLPLA